MSLAGDLEGCLTARQVAETIGWLLGRQTEYEPQSEEEDVEDGDAGKEEQTAGVRDDPVVIAGFQGRPGKPPDACYSFWCSAALSVRRPASSRGFR